MSLKSIWEETCEWCLAAVIAALTLLAIIWTVILVKYTGVLNTIEVMFPG